MVNIALEDALVVVFSDHGEQFFEHGALEHNNSLHAQETQALAVFWADNLVPVAVSTPTAHPDLAPTSLEALGVAAGSEMTGQPAGTADPGRPIFSTRFREGDILQAAGIGAGHYFCEACLDMAGFSTVFGAWYALIVLSHDQGRVGLDSLGKALLLNKNANPGLLDE